MAFLHHHQRAGIVTLLAGFLTAVVLVIGIGGAGADTCGTTNGSFGDTTVYVAGVGGADVESEHVGSSRDPGFWACAAPPNVGVGAAVRDSNGSTAGKQVEAASCVSALGGCTWLLQGTGAEVQQPSVSTDLPADGNGAIGGGVGSGADTCVYANGSPTCPGATPIAGVTVAEGDLPAPTVGGAGSVCVGVHIGGSCVGTWVTVPGSATVTVGGDGADTVTAEVAGTSQPVNVPQVTVPVL